MLVTTPSKATQTGQVMREEYQLRVAFRPCASWSSGDCREKMRIGVKEDWVLVLTLVLTNNDTLLYG